MYQGGELRNMDIWWGYEVWGGMVTDRIARAEAGCCWRHSPKTHVLSKLFPRRISIPSDNRTFRGITITFFILHASNRQRVNVILSSFTSQVWERRRVLLPRLNNEYEMCSSSLPALLTGGRQSRKPVTDFNFGLKFIRSQERIIFSVRNPQFMLNL